MATSPPASSASLLGLVDDLPDVGLGLVVVGFQLGVVLLGDGLDDLAERAGHDLSVDLDGGLAVDERDPGDARAELLHLELGVGDLDREPREPVEAERLVEQPETIAFLRQLVGHVEEHLLLTWRQQIDDPEQVRLVDRVEQPFAGLLR